MDNHDDAIKLIHNDSVLGYLFLPLCILLAVEDARDERPLTYPCKTLLPAMADANPAKMFWKKSGVFIKQRTEMALMIAGKDMRLIESVDEAAVPDSTDATESVPPYVFSTQQYCF